MPALGTWSIIIVSTMVFVADAATQRALLEWGAKTPAIWSGEAYRLFTATFLHADWRHLFFNMYALYMFGRVVEAILGTWRFTAVYLISGAAGYLLSLLVAPESTAVGASAAIFGLMGYTVHYRLRRLPLRYMRIDTELLQILGLNLLIGFLVPRIDQMAHLGGLLGGMAMASVVGMPAHGKEQRRRPTEALLASVLLAGLAFASLRPLTWAQRLQPISPQTAKWLDMRYGRYFSPLWADSVTLLWLPAQARSGWQPAPPALHVAPDQLLRLAVFWRWERGPGAIHPVPYKIAWERVLNSTPDSAGKSNRTQVVQEDRQLAYKPDTDAAMIYARSDVVVGPGRYIVHVIVDEREVWKAGVDVVVGSAPNTTQTR